MNKPVVQNKIESLRKCLLRIEQRCPDTLEALLNDLDAQDVLVLNISRAVQLCVDISLHILSEKEVNIPETMGQAFSALCSAGVIDEGLSLKMRKSVGFRNIAVHAYEEINLSIVYAIASKNRVDFKAFASQISLYVSLK